MEYKKVCFACGIVFVKPYNCSVKSFRERTRYCSFKCRTVKGEKNPMWKGDKIQRDSIHNWVARQWGSPKKCEICGTETAKKFEWSNKYHSYRRNREDWQRVCKKCHLAYDIKHNNYQHHIPSNTKIVHYEA